MELRVSIASHNKTRQQSQEVICTRWASGCICSFSGIVLTWAEFAARSSGVQPSSQGGRGAQPRCVPWLSPVGCGGAAVSQPALPPRRPRAGVAPPGLKLVLPGSSILFMSALALSVMSSPPQTSLTTWCCLTSPSHLEAFPGQGSPGE